MYSNGISRNCACNFFTYRTVLIITVWIVGLLLGCYLSFQSADMNTLVIQNTVFFPASIC